MVKEIAFQGFTEGTLSFFEGLAANNSKAWFEENKKSYEAEVVAPARAFIVALGAALRDHYPELVADPRVNKSMFRLNRDIRFSPDKTPYKTHLALLFWDDRCKRMEGPGFYFHLEPGKLMIAGGYHLFPKAALAAYREAVVDDKRGKALVDLLDELGQEGRMTLGGRHYKRVPRGYDKEHPRAELLKFNGLFASWEGEPPEALYSEALVEHTADLLIGLGPLYAWLMKVALG